MYEQFQEALNMQRIAIGNLPLMLTGRGPHIAVLRQVLDAPDGRLVHITAGEGVAPCPGGSGVD